MRKFEFRLQKVMETKGHLEEKLKGELATAKRKLEEEEGKLRELRERRECYRQLLREKGKAKMSVVEMLVHHAYLVRLTEEVAAQKARVDQMEEEVEKIRMELLETSKAKQILENLRQRRYEVFRRELNKLEQIFIDELSRRQEQAVIVGGSEKPQVLGP